MSRVNTYLELLKRRENFLKTRIKEREDKSKSHHDKHELNALSWAIKYIEDTIEPSKEHEENRFKETTNGKIS